MTLAALSLLAETGVQRVLNSLPAGLLIVLLAWLLLRFTGRHGSGTRFAVWFLTLLAIAILPFTPGLSATRALAEGARPQITLPGAWAVTIFYAWALIAVLATLRVAVGLWKLRSLRRDSQDIPASELPPALHETLNPLLATRRVAVRTSPDVSVPTAIGFFKPLVLIPGWALRDLSQDELKVVLLHELAHLQRWDDWTNLAQKLIRTAFFFHPAVWWLEKRLALEREMACDDIVLAGTRNPHAYAECLVSLAERSVARRGLALAQAVLGRAKDTSLRLAHILDRERNSNTQVFLPAMGIATVLMVSCLAVVPSAPVLVGFENPAPVARFAADRAHRVPQAQVISASLRTANHPEAAYDNRPSRKATQAAPHHSPWAPVAVPAKHKQSKPQPPAVVRAALEQTAPVAQFLVVLQSSEYDGTSAPVVSFAVWRVTLVRAGQNSVQTATIARVI